jgi:hypothetical protein
MIAADAQGLEEVLGPIQYTNCWNDRYRLGHARVGLSVDHPPYLLSVPRADPFGNGLSRMDSRKLPNSPDLLNGEAVIAATNLGDRPGIVFPSL